MRRFRQRSLTTTRLPRTLLYACAAVAARSPSNLPARQVALVETQFTDLVLARLARSVLSEPPLSPQCFQALAEAEAP